MFLLACRYRRDGRLELYKFFGLSVIEQEWEPVSREFAVRRRLGVVLAECSSIIKWYRQRGLRTVKCFSFTIYFMFYFFFLLYLFLLVCAFTIPWSIHWLTCWKPFSKPLCKPLFFFFLAKRELLSLHNVPRWGRMLHSRTSDSGTLQIKDTTEKPLYKGHTEDPSLL